MSKQKSRQLRMLTLMALLGSLLIMFGPIQAQGGTQAPFSKTKPVLNETVLPFEGTSLASFDLGSEPYVEPYVDPRDGQLKLLMTLPFARGLATKVLTQEEQLAVALEGHKRKDEIQASIAVEISNLNEEIKRKDAVANQWAEVAVKANEGLAAFRKQMFFENVKWAAGGVAVGWILHEVFD